MKRVIALLLALVMIFGVSACGNSDTKEPAESAGVAEEEAPEDAAEDDGKLKIGYYGISPTEAFSKEFYETVKNSCEEHGHELVEAFTDFDAAKMRAAYEQFKMEGVDIIIDGNQVRDSMTPFVEMALEDGIPYIACFVTYPDMPEVYTFGPENEQMGAATGEFLGKLVAEEWGGCDLVLQVGTFASAPDITTRLTSAMPVFSEYVDTTNVEVQELAVTAGNQSSAYQLVMDTLTAHPDMKTVIFCQTDDMANAAFSAVEAAGRADITMGVGSDCIETALEYWQTALKEDNTTAPWRGSIYLNTWSWGEEVISMCESICAGTQEEHAVVAPVSVAGLSNWEEYFPDLMERDFSASE